VRDRSGLLQLVFHPEEAPDAHALAGRLHPEDVVTAEGRLVPLYGPPVAALGSYYLVWPRATPARAPLQSFRDWLAADQA